MSGIEREAAPDIASSPTPGGLHSRPFSRRKFLTTAGLATAGLTLYSGEIERHHIDIVHRTIHIANLPSAFHGLRIAQLSDIHYDNFTEPFFVSRAIQHINALAPDVVLYTGDYISKGPNMYAVGERHAHLCSEILGQVACKQRFAILGNHDAYIGPRMVTAALQQNGIPVLANEYHPLERGNQRLWLVGLKDASDRALPDMVASLPPASTASEPIITLVHEPDFADDILASPLGARTSLILAGHSHGGQVCLPLIGPLLTPPMGKKYISGLYHFPRNERTLQLYVNRGLGTIGLPLRLYCPPEITLLTLSAEPA
jgi:predicted MPP superfamily phosphohydrolase